MSDIEENIIHEQQNGQGPANSSALHAIETVLKELAQGNADAAVRIFLKDQVSFSFPKDTDMIKWLIENFGKDATKKVIKVFTHAHCLNCKKGLQKCEGCGGSGHFKHDIVCDSCFGLGSTICNFCGGTGWATIDFVPAGLRFAVFVDRLKTAAAKAREICNQPLALPQKAAVSGTLSEHAQLLVDLNRQIAILEGVVSAPMQIVRLAHVPMPKISEIARTSITIALKSKKRLLEIVGAMANAAQIESGNYNKESKEYQIAAKRGDFYRSRIASVPPLAGTFLEHPFFDAVVKKTASDKTDFSEENSIM
jgi:hypothetical protein